MTQEGHRGLALLLTAIVVIHAAVAMWHGAAHVHLPVPLTPTQQAFVGGVILLLPLVGAALLWSRWRRAGALLITLTLLASLLFGLLNHFVFDSPDNVISVPEHAWQRTFVLSAALVAISESIGTAIAAMVTFVWWSAPGDRAF